MKLKLMVLLLGLVSMETIAGTCTLGKGGRPQDYYANCGINPRINLLADNPSAVGIICHFH